MKKILQQLGINANNAGVSTGHKWIKSKGTVIQSFSPVDGKLIASVTSATEKEYHDVVDTASAAFKIWRNMPAPKRGEVVRQIGEELRRFKEPLGKLVSYEMGKSLQEGLGEVQEIDRK